MQKFWTNHYGTKFAAAAYSNTYFNLISFQSNSSFKYEEAKIGLMGNPKNPS